MSELMTQGFSLAMVGMGVVFVFLAVLVILTTLMSNLLIRFGKVDTASATTTSRSSRPTADPRSPAGPDEIRRVAIISAAIRQHRNRH